MATPTTTKNHELCEAKVILVVDDEPTMLNLMCKVLRSGGYDVLQAGNGQDALAVSEASSKPIDTLVTDILMPGINGIDLYAKIKHQRPDIKVLFVSGYPGMLAGSLSLATAEHEALSKPFMPSELLCAVTRLCGPGM